MNSQVNNPTNQTYVHTCHRAMPECSRGRHRPKHKTVSLLAEPQAFNVATGRLPIALRVAVDCKGHGRAGARSTSGQQSRMLIVFILVGIVVSGFVAASGACGSAFAHTEHTHDTHTHTRNTHTTHTHDTHTHTHTHDTHTTHTRHTRHTHDTHTQSGAGECLSIRASCVSVCKTWSSPAMMVRPLAKMLVVYTMLMSIWRLQKGGVGRW